MKPICRRPPPPQPHAQRRAQPAESDPEASREAPRAMFVGVGDRGGLKCADAIKQCVPLTQRGENLTFYKT